MLKGNVVDQGEIEKWKTMAEINIQIEMIEGTIEELKKVTQAWKEILEKGHKYRQKELLDFYHSEIIEKIDK